MTRLRLSPEDRQAALIRAACVCLARGGIREFTVDRIAAEAEVSRGLIAHHFGSMDGLLAAVYAAMYGDWLDGVKAAPDIAAIIAASVSPPSFDPEVQKVWLALWGAIAVNPALRDEHRRLYAGYRALVAAALRQAARGRRIDADGLAAAFICLTDGFGVQRCVDPSLLSPDGARAACVALLGPHLGWLPTDACG